MHYSHSLLVLGCAAAALAQQVYVPAEGPVARPQCTPAPRYRGAPHAPASPRYAFSEFSFTQTETVRTATSVQPAPTTTYAPPYASLSHLVPGLSTTTWGNWDPNATTKATDTDDPYGQAAWSALWESASLANFTFRGLYSTTVSPTPVPTAELVYPPPDYFGPQDCYDFPDGFILGVAGSAAQIEGAIADEGKAPSLMEILGGITNGADDYTGDENYYLYKQDIARLAAIGVRYYSLSIQWTRILPFALPGTPVNQDGLAHYEDLIDFVLEKNMVPVVTLLHYDTPLQFYHGNFSAVGDAQLGYANGQYGDASFPDAFVHYGKIVMTHFADRVPVWFTYNEPLLYSKDGKSVDHVLKSHAQLYHFYKEALGGTGQVAMKYNDNFGVPRDPQKAGDVAAAHHFNELQIGTFNNPTCLGLDYPEAFKASFPDHVPLTAEDLAYLNGTADFIGIDPYTVTVVAPPSYGIGACAANQSDSLFPYCVHQSTTTTTGWDVGLRSASYVYITPTYLRTYLGYLWNTWQRPIMITEFGFPVFGEAAMATLDDELLDTPRSLYYQSYLSEVLKAIWEDHVHVLGAFAWSFVDNWEFGSFDAHFGLQTVNRTTQERRFKKSFFDLVDYVAARTPKTKGKE